MRKFSVRPTLTFKGRKFKGLRGWSGKPLHPPLTDFPIVAYVLAARRMQRMIDATNDHYVICGFGRVGREIARDFTTEKIPFVVIDIQPASLERAAAWDQAEADLGLSEDCLLSTPKSDVASECKFIPSRTRPTTYDRDTDDIAMRKSDGRLTPARLSEPAHRLADAVVGEKEVWIRALERDDLQRRLRLDGFHQVEDLVIHPVVNRVDRWIVERRAPVPGHLLVDRDVGRRRADRHRPSSAARASVAMSALVFA